MSLVVRSAGMVTAIGLSAAASSAALRARIDGFAETRFLGPGGEWLIGAAVPLPRNWIGQKRMAHLLAGCLVEILQDHPEARTDCHLLLCLAEEDRPGPPIPDREAFLAAVAKILPGFEPEIRVFPYGRPSGVLALQRAEVLVESGARNVIIAGVDSYLTGRSISHYLAAERLLSPANSEGFIPGEAAAAVLVTRGGAGLSVAGIGLGREDASIYNGKDKDGLNLPLRAEGMSTAYEAAFSASGRGHAQIGVKIGDLIGESFWFRETALAMHRTQRELSDVHPIWTIGSCLGNIGAAVVPVMLGWAKAAKQKGYGGEKPMLVQASGDDGACGAVVVEAA